MKRKNREISVARMFSSGIDSCECKLFHDYDRMEKPKQKSLAFILTWTAGALAITGVSILSLVVLGMNVIGILGLCLGLACNTASLTNIKELRNNDEVRNLKIYKQVQALKKDGSWEKIRQNVAKYEKSVANNSNEEYLYTKGTQVRNKKEESSFKVEENDIKSL